MRVLNTEVQNALLRGLFIERGRLNMRCRGWCEYSYIYISFGKADGVRI